MIQRIEVFGVPKPGGSKTSYFIPKLGRTVTTDACKTVKFWRQDVAEQASEQCLHQLDGPLAVVAYIRLQRPKSHYKKNGQLKPTAPPYPDVRPDATKLWRSTEDALTGIAWKDDAKIVSQLVSKVYADRPGAEIFIEEILIAPF